jgi:RNA polymerase sigma factor (sigma-70 family)
VTSPSHLLAKLHKNPELISSVTDTELLKRYSLNRDEAAFAELVRRSGPIVLRVCRQLLGEASADDAFQAVFLILIRSAHRLKKPGSLAGWLHAVAVRVANKARRNESRRRKRDSVHQIPTSTTSDDLSWREVREILHSELASLPEQYRNPLLLCYFQELTHEEAASQLNCSIGVLRGRLERGRERFRRRLSRYGLPLAAPVLVFGEAPPVSAALLESTLKVMQIGISDKQVPPSIAELLRPRGRVWLSLLLAPVLALGVVASMGLESPPPFAQPLPEEPMPPQSKQVAANSKPPTDALGDPLPKDAVARLGTVRLRRAYHTEFSPDGKTIVTHAYGTLRVWDVKSGQELKRFPSVSSCYGLAVSPDGKQVAVSINAGKKIDVVNLEDGKTIHHFECPEPDGHNDHKVHSLAFSSDGKSLFTSDDNNGYVWDLTTGKQKSSFSHPGQLNEGVWTVAFSDNGKFLATDIGQSIEVWEVASGKWVKKFDHPSQNEKGIGLSKSGNFLALAGRNSIEVRELPSGNSVHRLDDRNAAFESLAFSPDESLLAIADSGSRDHESVIHFWDLKTEKMIRTIPAPQVIRMRFSPDGAVLAWESGECVSIVETKSGKALHSFSAHTDSITSVAYSSDRKVIATGSADGDIRLWDAATSSPVRVLYGHANSVHSVAFSPDGKQLVSGGTDNSAILWEVGTGKKNWHMKNLRSPVNSVVFSPDGKSVAVGGMWSIVIGSVETGQRLDTLEQENDIQESIAYLRDGKHLAAGSHHALRIWNLETRKVETTLSSKSVISVAVSSDGKYLAAGSGETYVWEVDNWKLVATLPGMHNRIGGVAFSPDNALLAVASDGLSGLEKINVHVFETQTWKDVSPTTFPRNRYTSVAFSPDSKYLATGSVHAEALIWDMRPKR